MRVMLMPSEQELFDNNHRIVTQKGGSGGRFTFTAHEAGDHKICFTPSSNSGKSGWLSTSNPNGGIKLTLDMTIGETSVIESSDKDKLEDIQTRIKDLNSRLQDIRREQVFQRVRCGLTLWFTRPSVANLTTGTRGGIPRPVRNYKLARCPVDAHSAGRPWWHLRVAAFSPAVLLHQAEAYLKGRGLFVR